MASGKATLRAVADAISRSMDNTIYVPGSEMVAGLPDISTVLQDDPRIASPEGEIAAAGFDAEASIAHLHTVICDEVAIEQSLQP